MPPPLLQCLEEQSPGRLPQKQGGYPKNRQAVEGERQKRRGEMTALQQRLPDESRYSAGPKMIKSKKFLEETPGAMIEFDAIWSC